MNLQGVMLVLICAFMTIGIFVVFEGMGIVVSLIAFYVFFYFFTKYADGVGKKD